MIPTPPPREDGRCLTCLGPRVVIPKTLVNRTARDLKLALEADPFCSTNCARAYYGTSLPALVTGPHGKRIGRPPKPPATLMHGTEYGYVHHGCRCDACRAAGTEARRGRARGGRAA